MNYEIRAYEFLKIFGPNALIWVKNPGESDEDLRLWSDKELYAKTIIHADIEYVRGHLVIAVTMSSGDVTPSLFPHS